MAIKEKIIGVILILLGAWPFLLKIKAVGEYFKAYTFLGMLTPGKIVYQLAIILLGIVLIWRFKVKGEMRK